MNHSAQLERIRQFVQETFEQLAGISDATFRESILVRDGQYCGRRFLRDSLQAVWFVEENELKFYGKDGAMLKVVAADGVPSQHRRAAA
jgi:hypothetical protein